MRKLDQKGITHHLLILAIAALVIAVSGFGAYRIIKQRSGISAKADTWSQRPGSDTPVIKTNGSVLGGSFFTDEINVSTKVMTPSPLKQHGNAEYGNGFFGGYDYVTGDMYYVKSIGSPRTSYQIKKVVRATGATVVLRDIPVTEASYVDLCAGKDYIAYIARGAADFKVIVATKDHTQFRTVADRAAVTALGAGPGASDISCGDQYFYLLSGKKVIKAPYNPARTKSTFDPRKRLNVVTTYTIPSMTTLYDLPDYNYFFCGTQYQSDTRLAMYKDGAANGIDIVDATTKQKKSYPVTALNNRYYFCSLSPDGKYMVNGDGVGLIDLTTSQKIGNLSTSTSGYYTYGWRAGQ